MPRYLTVQQFRLSDPGIANLSSLSDLAVAFQISQAESAIDAAMGFNQLAPSGFAPGVLGLAQQGFDFTTRRMRFQLPPVPVRQILRAQVHISNATQGSVPYVATLSPSDVIINEWGQYLELVPLQALSWSLAPVLAQLGAQPPILEIDMECGYYLASLGEPLYNLNSDLKTYRSLRSFWASTYTQTLAAQPQTLPPVPPVLYVNGVAAASTTYTVNYTEGQVVFSSARASSDVVTADLTYQIPDNVRDAAIAQTIWEIVQRQVTQDGLLPYQRARLGDQDVILKPTTSASGAGPSALCEDAARYLRGYGAVPMA